MVANRDKYVEDLDKKANELEKLAHKNEQYLKELLDL